MLGEQCRPPNSQCVSLTVYNAVTVSGLIRHKKQKSERTDQLVLPLRHVSLARLAALNQLRRIRPTVFKDAHHLQPQGIRRIGCGKAKMCLRLTTNPLLPIPCNEGNTFCSGVIRIVKGNTIGKTQPVRHKYKSFKKRS